MSNDLQTRATKRYAAARASLCKLSQETTRMASAMADPYRPIVDEKGREVPPESWPLPSLAELRAELAKAERALAAFNELADMSYEEKRKAARL